MPNRNFGQEVVGLGYDRFYRKRPTANKYHFTENRGPYSGRLTACDCGKQDCIRGLSKWSVFRDPFHISKLTRKVRDRDRTSNIARVWSGRGDRIKLRK